MKICFAFEHLFPAAGRAGRHIETLVRKFQERGHEVSVISTPVDEPIDVDGIELLRLRETPGAKGHARRDSLMGKAITKFLKENEVQLLFAEGLTPLSAVTVKAAKRASSACILRVLSDASGIVHSIGGERRLTPSALKKRVATMLGYADIAAASSEHCADLLREVFDGDVRVIEKCVDLTLFNPNRVRAFDLDAFREKYELEDRTVLLYARENIRAETMVAALPVLESLVKERQDIVFTIAGHLDDPETVENAINDAGLRQHVKILGRLSQRDLCTAYCVARLYFAPADSRASESELLEAMAMRCAVACSVKKAEAMMATIENSGAIILSDDSEEAARELLSLLEDGDRLIEVQDSSFEYAQRLDIGIAVDRVHALCEDVLGLTATKVEQVEEDAAPEDGDEESRNADPRDAAEAEDDEATPRPRSRRGRGRRGAEERADDKDLESPDEESPSEVDSGARPGDDDDEEEEEEGLGLRRRRRRRSRRRRPEETQAEDRSEDHSEDHSEDQDEDSERDANEETSDEEEGTAPRRRRRERGRGRGRGANADAESDETEDSEVVSNKGKEGKDGEEDEIDIEAASQRLRDLDPRLTLRDLMPFLRPPKNVFVLSLAATNGQHRAGEAIYESFRTFDQNLKVRQINILDYLGNGVDAEEISDRVRELHADESSFSWPISANAEDNGQAEEHDDGQAPVAAEAPASVFDGIFDKKLDNLILEKRPDQIVLTHYLPLKRIAELKRDNDLRLKLAVVVTELDLHPHWIAEGVDQYHVPSEKIRYKMIRAGVPAQSIETIGLPVHPRFEEDVDRDKVKRDLGLKNGQPTVLLRPGGIGDNDTLIESIKGMLSVGGNFNLMVLAGKNEPLLRALKGLKTPRGAQLKPFGFVENIREIMGVADLMITRASGHTMAEAFAAGLPMILVRPTPGVEDRTADWFVQQGVAVKARDNIDLEWYLSDLMKNQGRGLRDMRDRARSEGRTRSGAATRSVERITKELH